jgi:hypothetical protein
MDFVEYIDGVCWVSDVTSKERKAIMHPQSMRVEIGNKFYVTADESDEIIGEDFCISNFDGFVTGKHGLATHKAKKYVAGNLVEGEVIHVPNYIGVDSKVNINLFGDIREATVKAVYGKESVQVTVDGLEYGRNLLTEIKVLETTAYYYVYQDNYTKLLLYIYNHLQPKVLELTKFEEELLIEVNRLLKL